MSGIRNKRIMTEKPPVSDEEPFWLTLLPFVGLGLLLVLAVVWRVMPEKFGAASGNDLSLEERDAMVVSRWSRAPKRDIPIDSGRDFVLGPEDALVTFVEFSDFQCPYCRTAANGVHDILREFPSAVRLVFKNFPLDVACNDMLGKPMHHLACEAAAVAWCAGQQDEALFWEVHDAFFREPQWNAATLDRIPDDNGVDRDSLEACLASDTPEAAIREDIKTGRELGVSGTPVFFANGRRVSDYRRDSLEAVVEHILTNE